jgi:tetratricopeptide (TPR) repeat protein
MTHHEHEPGDEPDGEMMPEVMMLPLAVPEELGFGDLDSGVLARRIPDFVHRVLNRGQIGPTGMLEVQTPPEEGPVLWVVMDMPPDPDEAFSLLPVEAEVRAIVTGEVLPVPDGFRVEFHVYFAEDSDERFVNKVGGVLRRDYPVVDLLQLTRRLARILELPYQEPPKGTLTANGDAFFLFLRALDNAMLLSGDLQIDLPENREALLQPFSDALTLDPKFGLALRVAHTTVALAVDEGCIDAEAARRFLDTCYSIQPGDGEGCVAVADHLRELGDDARAMAWLEHATHLDPPPSRGLENLGILFAHSGRTVAARELWMRGLQLDGHPDFFGHLARLAFAEGRELDAWDLVVRGLRRLRERVARASEWDDEDRGAGVLLMYVHEHMAQRAVPDDVHECLLDLRLMLDGDSKASLGLCLLACDERDAAREELAMAIGTGTLTGDTRDHVARALLGMELPDFDRRFAKAAEQALRHKKPRECLVEFALFVDLQPTFWPAFYYAGIAHQRLGETGSSLDMLDAARRLSPDQPEVLHHMAVVFAERGNQKRALELIDEALASRDDGVQLHLTRAQILIALGRPKDARESIDRGLGLDAADHELLRLRQQIGE